MIEKFTKELPETACSGEADLILCLALDIGEAMLRSGGEINRIEDTVERICRAYGARDTQVFTLPSVIIAAIRLENGEYSNQTRRIKGTSNDLFTLELFNNISREVCAAPPPLEELKKKIGSAKKMRLYPTIARLIASALAAGAFTLFFGGGIVDGLIAAFIGIIVFLIDGTKVTAINQMAKLAINSFSAGAIACLSVILGIGSNGAAIIIGTVMLLIPGLAFGTAVRNLLCGDLLSGSLEIVRACISAFMIALGYSLSMILIGQGILPSAALNTAPLQLIGATVGSVAFAIIFNSHPKHILPVAVGGLGTYFIYFFCDSLGASAFICALFASLFFAFFAEILARTLKAPAIVFLLPCAIPIVPGGSLYNSMVSLISKDTASALSHIGSAVQIGLGMACGIMAVSVIFGLLFGVITKRKTKR